MPMKVCPVCEMEEEDNALSCSMCGSDFEPALDDASQQEVEPEPDADLSTDIAAMDLGDSSAGDKASENTRELTEEEKLLEEEDPEQFIE